MFPFYIERYFAGGEKEEEEEMRIFSRGATGATRDGDDDDDGDLHNDDDYSYIYETQTNAERERLRSADVWMIGRKSWIE